MHAFGTRAAGHERSLEDFTGHDLTIEGYQGVLDMNARQFIPGLGMFGGVDPLASSFPSYTPYHYVHNNPINLIDPTGMSSESIHEDVNGNVIAEIDDGDNNVYRHDDIGGDGQHIDGQIAKLQQKREIDGTGGGGEKQKIKSALNKISKWSQEGDQQQHSGENWYIYGKGSDSGWSINAPKPDPDGVNKDIDIRGMFPAGGGIGKGDNPIRGVIGFDERVKQLTEGSGEGKSKKEQVSKSKSVPDTTWVTDKTFYLY